MKRCLFDAAQAMGGSLLGENIAYGDVSTDSRTLQAGALFVALRGPNFDGAGFVAAAAAQGAVAAVVERSVAVDMPQIVVPDALVALQQLGSAWRAGFDIPVVGVAGSNGKTTTKGMIAAILSRRGPCLATRGNLNNHIGVPLTLLCLEAAHRSAVVEMGANRVGGRRRTGRSGAPQRRTHHQRRRGTPRRLHRHGRCRQGRGRDGGRSRVAGHRHHQRRRSLRRLLARRCGGGAGGDVRCDGLRGFHGTSGQSVHRRWGVRDPLRTGAALGGADHRAAGRWCAQYSQCARSCGGGHGCGCVTRRHRGRDSGIFAPSRADCSSRRECATAGSSTTPTTRIPAR